jgi:flavin-dependent dehydrogenase
MASLAHDVAVVGGGPAGATAALTLARVGLDVVMVEASRYQRVRLGETVPPPARKVLARLGLGANWAATEVTPSFGTSSAWGGPELASNSFISSPYGNGWHLDRRRFDLRLGAGAAAAGVRLVQGVRVTACTPAPRDTWRLTLDRDGRANGMTVGAVVDATGRRARLARALGARRHVVDRLVGVAVQYRGAPTDGGFTLVEAVRDGWWYSAPVPPRWGDGDVHDRCRPLPVAAVRRPGRLGEGARTHAPHLPASRRARTALGTPGRLCGQPSP